ncbi:unnamed protein product, partial [Iphiclides podalirius]
MFAETIIGSEAFVGARRPRAARVAATEGGKLLRIPRWLDSVGSQPVPRPNYAGRHIRPISERCEVYERSRALVCARADTPRARVRALIRGRAITRPRPRAPGNNRAADRFCAQSLRAYGPASPGGACVAITALECTSGADIGPCLPRPLSRVCCCTPAGKFNDHTEDWRAVEALYGYRRVGYRPVVALPRVDWTPAALVASCAFTPPRVIAHGLTPDRAMRANSHNTRTDGYPITRHLAIIP